MSNKFFSLVSLILSALFGLTAIIGSFVGYENAYHCQVMSLLWLIAHHVSASNVRDDG